MIGAHKNLNGSRNLTTPLSEKICHLWLALATINLPTKFEVSTSTHSFFFLFSLRRDVAISAEASNGPNAQPHIPKGLKSLRGFCKPQKSTPVHLT